MIRIAILYPRSEGTTFDNAYYTSTHMPLVAKSWPQVTKWEADFGVADQPHHAIGYLYLDSMEALGAMMGSPATGTVMADVPNYTNVQPQMFVSEVASSS